MPLRKSKMYFFIYFRVNALSKYLSCNITCSLGPTIQRRLKAGFGLGDAFWRVMDLEGLHSGTHLTFYQLLLVYVQLNLPYKKRDKPSSLLKSIGKLQKDWDQRVLE
ncbi:unnamed protein product [Meganyctiphanes norvegica]|uniref:Uncharacterized protein n=1 Tax=Meganyctiphanes norvegica TaxID=48144 RepID=A0AAV2RRJ8_MEGNR